MRSLLLAAVLAVAVSPLIAQTEKPAADAKQPAWLTTIAPLVNQDTFMVAYVNLSEKNVQAAVEQVDKITAPFRKVEGAATEPSSERAIKPATPGDQMKAMYAKFTKAGGKDLYVVATGPREGQNSPDEPLLAISLAPDADITALAELIRPSANDNVRQRQLGDLFRKVGNLLVIARTAQLKELDDFKPSARPELAKAMAAIPDASACLVYLPTPALRKMLTKTATSMPAELGGGSTEPFVEGVQWGVFGLTIQPDLALDLVVQGKDAQTAKDILAAYTQVMDAMRKWATKSILETPVFVTIAPGLTEYVETQVKGTQLVLHLGQKQIDGVIQKSVIPIMRQYRYFGEQMAAMNAIRNLLTSCTAYQTQQDKWPDGFETLLQAKMITANMLVNPRCPNLKLGFIYRKPGKDALLANTSTVVVIHENYDKWPGSIAVGYADGHVDVIKNEQAFLKLIGQATTAPLRREVGPKEMKLKDKGAE